MNQAIVPIPNAIDTLPETPAAYVLRCTSAKGKTYYYRGSTINLRRRMREHAGRIGSKYTRRFSTLELVAFNHWGEGCLRVARQYERWLKTCARGYIEKIWIPCNNKDISGYNPGHERLPILLRQEGVLQ